MHNNSRKALISAAVFIVVVASIVKLSIRTKLSRDSRLPKDICQQRRRKTCISENETYYGFTPRLSLLYEAAYRDYGIQSTPNVDQNYALYPRAYYRNVSRLLSKNQKVYDFCFIGGLRTDRKTFTNRKWILSFIDDKFGPYSYLQYTDKVTKSKMNLRIAYFFDSLFKHRTYFYDYTWDETGFVPKYAGKKDRKYFDAVYFNVMSQCKFCLSPAGDVLYSMRFYEALMAKCIPIVDSVRETYRSKAESELGYKYYLSCEDAEYRDDWINLNYKLFLKYHTLEHFTPPENATFLDQRRKRIRKLQQQAIASLIDAQIES